MEIPIDDREITWAEIEASVASRAENKDSNFKLTGPWKTFRETNDGFHVYIVDGEWVRNNLSIIFGHGGHGYVHEFIPHDEIWIDPHHIECECENVREDRKMSESYIKSTILHEITEYKEMKKGKIFWEAHNIALEAERQAGFLSDPYTEVNE
jgi:hypothetical protein